MSVRKKAVRQQANRPASGAASRIYSRQNVGRYSERARQRRRGHVIRRGILCGVLGVLLVGAVAAGSWFSSIVSRLNNSDIITSDLVDTLVETDVTSEPFYMLLLGTDGRSDDEADRTDSIILVRVDPVEQQVTLISIPRDTAYEYNGSTVKINAVYTYGGADDMVEAVNDLCGVQISHYAEVSFEGLESLVDAVGGIDLYVPEGDGVDDPEAGSVVIEEGQQHLDGEAALTFCRARHQYIDGDYTRMRHQRMVIGALADKILNELDISDIVPLVESLADMVVTDLSPTDIASIVSSLSGMDTDSMYSANLPSWSGDDTYIDGQSYVFVYEDELEEMMERVDAGEDPEGPQTMGTGGDGEGTTVGDLYTNSNEDWLTGTATSSSSSSSSDTTSDSTSTDTSTSSESSSDTSSYSSDSSSYSSDTSSY